MSPTANQHAAIATIELALAGTSKYERRSSTRSTTSIMLVERAEDYRIEYNQTRPHGAEAIAWNRPTEVHLGPADPTTPRL